MDPNISAQIGSLLALPTRQLLALWKQLYGTASPPALRRELLIRFLAYRLQENAFGGLSPSTAAQLRRIARGLESSTGISRRNGRPMVCPGTRLCRRWHGQTHEIKVVASGFEYRGIVYGSLSRVARQITGTRWSGPAFFKLNVERKHA
jgi:hypothetical protein